MQILRITRGRIRPGTWDQFEKALQQSVQDVGHVPGLITRSLARDTKDPDQGYSLSVWESLEDAENYEKSELAKIITPQLQAFFTGDYRSDHCEIRYWETRA